MITHLHNWDKNRQAVWLILALFIFLSTSSWTSNLMPNNMNGCGRCSSSSFSSSKFTAATYMDTKSSRSLHFRFIVDSFEMRTMFSSFNRLFSTTEVMYSQEDKVNDDLWSSSMSLLFLGGAWDCAVLLLLLLGLLDHAFH